MMKVGFIVNHKLLFYLLHLRRSLGLGIFFYFIFFSSVFFFFFNIICHHTLALHPLEQGWWFVTWQFLRITTLEKWAELVDLFTFHVSIKILKHVLKLHLAFTLRMGRFETMLFNFLSHKYTENWIKQINKRSIKLWNFDGLSYALNPQKHCWISLKEHTSSPKREKAHLFLCSWHFFLLFIYFSKIQ